MQQMTSVMRNLELPSDMLELIVLVVSRITPTGIIFLFYSYTTFIHNYLVVIYIAHFANEYFIEKIKTKRHNKQNIRTKMKWK